MRSFGKRAKGRAGELVFLARRARINKDAGDKTRCLGGCFVQQGKKKKKKMEKKKTKTVESFILYWGRRDVTHHLLL